MIANFGLVVRPVVGLLFLIAGILLWKRARAGGALITIGAVLFLGAEIYGVAVLRPFVGRPFDDAWREQIATVDTAATLGLLVSAVGLLLNSRKP